MRTVRHPGEFIREEIPTELNLSATRAAHIPGVRRATLSDLMNEKVSLSPEMALRIEKAFGVPWTPCRAAEIEVQRYESVR
ncbi:MAG: HigA family addiction module antidote protein [Alphaproteobacteria bacterium]|nr:HigA family addiction module antidote protein [Alphaproteobacteria bacterium]